MCEVEVVDLHDTDYQFYAVSYTWGSDVKDKSVLWLHRRIHVTESCYDVCRQIMAKTRMIARDLWWVWIDQISIDQSNDAERGQQIRMMGDIFRAAHTVVVFLGDPTTATSFPETRDTGSQKAAEKQIHMLMTLHERTTKRPSLIADLHSLSKKARTAEDVVLLKGLILCDSVAQYQFYMDEYEKYVSSPLVSEIPYENISVRAELLYRLLQDAEAWQGLRSIFNRNEKRNRYFRRRWIIQEALRTDAVVHVGEFRMVFSNFLMGIVVLAQCRDDFDERLIPLAKSMPVNSLKYFFDELEVETEEAMTMMALSMRIKNERNLDLAFVLDHTNKAECFDLKDVFYAVRSLVSSQQPRPPLPDYTISTLEVVRQHLVYFLDDKYGPALIQRAGLQNGAQRIADLPSWCPLWLGSDDPARPRRYLLDLNEHGRRSTLYMDEHELGPDPAIRLRAGSTRPVSLSWDARPRSLVVRGVLVGTVSRLYPDGAPNDTMSSLIELLPDGAKGYRVSEGAVSFFENNSTVKSDIPNQELMDRYGSHLRNEVARLTWEQNDHPKTYRDLQMYLGLPSWGPEGILTDWFQLDVMLMRRSLCAIAVHPALIPAFLDLETNEDKSLNLSVVGIGPCVANQGDVVVIFDGFETPTVLRQCFTAEPDHEAAVDSDTKARWHVVGDAHFMQLADGKLLGKYKGEGTEFTII
ncbi:hypothetical protein H2200_003946 [Cladophialophora chaetospira]|uniref:Heterokaryon incompatibility domain-containing protein n=1 Tax=Cladophialophora chaetospira TaxID=386627 RepID=A0AA39CKF5_9EURO|nr:hypothetical protein H2200_003946 [Cladophialophora chaetospira]